MSALERWRKLKNNRASLASSASLKLAAAVEEKMEQEHVATSSSTASGEGRHQELQDIVHQHDDQHHQELQDIVHQHDDQHHRTNDQQGLKDDTHAIVHHQNDSREREDESADVEVINFLTTQLEDAKRETEHLEHEKEVLIEGFKEIEAVKVSELRKVFNTIDADDSGEIDVDEFMNAMKNDTSVREFFGLNDLNSEMSDAEEFFEIMFKSMDADDDKSITFLEFERHIAQMALKSIVELRENFEFEKQALKEEMAQEAEKVTENYSQYAAKAVSKAQKKVAKREKQLEEANAKIASLVSELKKAEEREADGSSATHKGNLPKSEVQSLFEKLNDENPGRLSEKGALNIILEERALASLFNIDMQHGKQVWRKYVENQLGKDRLTSTSDLEMFIFTLPSYFASALMDIERDQKQMKQEKDELHESLVEMENKVDRMKEEEAKQLAEKLEAALAQQKELHQAEIGSKDVELNSLKHEIDSKVSEVHAKEEVINILENDGLSKDAEVREKNKTIESLESDLQTKDRLLKSLEEQVALNRSQYEASLSAAGQAGHWKEEFDKLKSKYMRDSIAKDEFIKNLQSQVKDFPSMSEQEKDNVALAKRVPDIMKKMNDLLERLGQEKTKSMMFQEQLKVSQRTVKRLEKDNDELRENVRNLEAVSFNSGSQEAEAQIEAKINIILQRASKLMNESSVIDDKEECHFRMEALLFQFDKCARSLHDTHDESNRHLVFVRSRLERLLSKLEQGLSPEANMAAVSSPSRLSYTPGTPRLHRSDGQGSVVGSPYGKQPLSPKSLMQLATKNIEEKIRTQSNSEGVYVHDEDHLAEKQSLSASLSSMTSMVKRLHVGEHNEHAFKNAAEALLSSSNESEDVNKHNLETD